LTRGKRAIKCWSGGLGDDIHNVISKVEGFIFEQAPKPVVNMITRFARIATRGRSNTFSSCASCGGTSVMKADTNNLGRAGRLNNMFKKKGN